MLVERKSVGNDQCMCPLRRLVVGLALAGNPAHASGPIDLPREFADCAGRYSAMLEHAWLMQLPEAEEYARLRAAFVSLLEASGGGTAGDGLHLRIDSKVAHARLLHLSSFGRDREIAGIARRRSEAHLSRCRRLVLGG